ncbi:hypothetical protein ACS0TY_034699 [Phlomoides rotata]
MSGISASGAPLSCPSKLIKNSQKTISISSTSSHFPVTRTLFPEFVSKRKHIYRANCSSETPLSLSHHHLSSSAASLFDEVSNISHSGLMEKLVLIDLDPATAKLGIVFLGPFLSAFGFLFIARIVMSWYPKLPVDEFPYVIAYAPTEPLLVQTRKVIAPVGGVDVTPVVWFALISFLNEILVGPQGLLVLLSQQQV